MPGLQDTRRGILQTQINRCTSNVTPSPRVRGDDVESDYAAGGFSLWRGDTGKIPTPSALTPTECSNCADSERSRVTAVQPSDRIFTCGLPRLIIGSMVKNMPGFSVTPSPGRPM